MSALALGLRVDFLRVSGREEVGEAEPVLVGVAAACCWWWWWWWGGLACCCCCCWPVGVDALGVKGTTVQLHLIYVHISTNIVYSLKTCCWFFYTGRVKFSIIFCVYIFYFHNSQFRSLIFTEWVNFTHKFHKSALSTLCRPLWSLRLRWKRIF